MGSLEDDLTEYYRMKERDDKIEALNARIADLTAAHAAHVRVLQLERDALRVYLAEARLERDIALTDRHDMKLKTTEELKHVPFEMYARVLARAERAEAKVGELEERCKEWQGAFAIAKARAALATSPAKEPPP